MYSNSHVSTYRYQTCEVLTRIFYATGQEFPISGDAPLRMQARLLKTQADNIYTAHSTPNTNPCDYCNGTGQHVNTLSQWQRCTACNGTGRHRP